VDVWTTIGYARKLGAERWVSNPRGGGFNMIGRMRAGVSVAQARQDIERVARGLAADGPQISGMRRPIVAGLLESETENVRPALLMLLAAVGLVLIVAWVNVMNLVLARQTSRSHETWVRRAPRAPTGPLMS